MKNKGRHIFYCTMFTGLALLLSVLLGALPAGAQVLDLTDMVVDNVEGKVRLRFGLKVQDGDELSEVLEEGGLLELQCRVSLNRKRGLWWDKTLSNRTYTSTIDANPLTREYFVTVAAAEKKDTGKNLTKLLNTTWQSISIDLGPWNELSRGEDYYILLEVELTRVDIPVWLRRSLFFWSWDVVPSTYYELNFTY